MRARRAFIVAATMAVGAALGLPLTVAAHALPQSAIPPEGAEVQTAPKVVEITFGETPDPQLSSITVVNGSGVSVDAGPTVVVPGHPLELEVSLKPIGRRRLHGDVEDRFRDGRPPRHRRVRVRCRGVGGERQRAREQGRWSRRRPRSSRSSVAWLFFIGVDGHRRHCVDVSLRVARTSRRSTGRMLAGAWIVGTLGIAGVVEAQREAAGVGFSSLFSTSLGTTAIERVAAMAATGLAVIAASVAPTAAKRAAVIAGGHRRRGFDMGRRRGEPRRRAGAGRGRISSRSGPTSRRAASGSVGCWSSS